MCGKYHHVIPRELGTWLFQEYSLEWDDNFTIFRPMVKPVMADKNSY